MSTATHSSRSEQLDEQGYIVVNDVLDKGRDLQPILNDYAHRLDLIANSLYESGKISQTYSDMEFGPRLIQTTSDYGESLSQHFDISLPQKGIRSDTPLHLTESCFRLLTNKNLLDLAEELIGPEILVSPVGHVRIKLPEDTLAQGDGQMAKIPWHQDNGVVLDEADQSNVLTVWVAINDATIENGCMQVLPCSRRTDLIPHCPSTSKGAHIPDRQVDEGQARQLTMKAGSVLLMHPRTVHSSLGNSTVDQVRISMDLRYQPISEPTGRPMFPAFVGRSRSNPTLALRDPEQWTQMWLAARARLAEDQPAAFNRWDADSPACA